MYWACMTLLPNSYIIVNVFAEIQLKLDIFNQLKVRGECIQYAHVRTMYDHFLTVVRTYIVVFPLQLSRKTKAIF